MQPIMVPRYALTGVMTPALIVGVGPRRGLIMEFELNNDPSPFPNLRISLIPAWFQKGST
jgi:hypothetical protein